jgi:hypothetical protein
MVAVDEEVMILLVDRVDRGVCVSDGTRLTATE